MADERLEKRPAVLLLDDGSRVELPDCTVGEAHALVDFARQMDEPIGGEIDPRRIVSVGFEPEGDR